MPTQPESMKSDMAGNQMCRAGSKIINRAQPWSQTRISVTNKLGIHFSSSLKGFQHSDTETLQQQVKCCFFHLRPHWDVNCPHRHVCRVKYLEIGQNDIWQKLPYNC